MTKAPAAASVVKKHTPFDTEISSSHSPLLSSIGDATTVILLLSDYEKYGLSERVCYHFDLTEALFLSDDGAKKVEAPVKDSQTHHNVCGVASLLECAPLTPWHRLNKRQKRALKNELRAFNSKAQKVRQEKSMACYEPEKLPLRLNPSTRTFFTYEVTRIAFCVDASPSLTSTFGIMGGPQSRCCPLDRLPDIARTFFSSLIEPVSAPLMESSAGIWRPELAVSVLAVFPLGKHSETNLLVRDFRVNDAESAKVLTDRMEEWIRGEVEMGIASRVCRQHEASTWSAPLYSSSLSDILEAGDYALSILSSEARPLIVVATDGRSVSCDGILDVLLDLDRVDVPLVVLDLSCPETHVPFSMEEEAASEDQLLRAAGSEPSFLSYDPGGPLAFPLHLSDDTEALYEICRATGGCFLDSQLLSEAAASVAGQSTGILTTRMREEHLRQESEATALGADHYFSFKRKFVKMNGLQWLTLFSLSPLSPTFHSSWSKLVPPQYLRRRLAMGSKVDAAPQTKDIGSDARGALGLSRHDGAPRQSSDNRRGPPVSLEVPLANQRKLHSRVTFSTYMVSPIRVKGLLLMMIKEGYRAKQYGQSTQDPDKVGIQFTLPLELGTILHYELSFKARPNQSHMVGSAHVKIELSGDPVFIQSVKKDFLRQVTDGRPFTMAQKVSSRLCTVLRYMRKEDCLESYLCPPSQWSDQLSSPDAPFVRRLASLKPLQRRRHFQADEFDVVCTGQMPYESEDDFFSEFISLDNGEQELFDGVAKWATQTVKEKSRYVKSTVDSDGLTGYYVVEIYQSPIACRLFTITIESLCGSIPCDRLAMIASLKRVISDMKDVEVLGKQMGHYLVGTGCTLFWKRRNVQIEYQHATWDLVMDPELLPLLMKRRTEIGNFRLLQSTDDHAVFAKLVPEAGQSGNILGGSPGDLIQYQIRIMPDKVVVDFHMESEGGKFSLFRNIGKNNTSRFERMAMILRRRDQECGRALRSRTNLLRVYNSNGVEMADEEDHLSSVQRILAYSSKVSQKLRFFNPKAAAANDALMKITEELILCQSFGARAAKLLIDPGVSLRGEEPGLWFILRFDRYTMSLVHLSLVDKQGNAGGPESYTYRELTFFTIGISDLYSKRDDVVDDDSLDSHISEYLCVTEYADHVEASQKENYAAASYLALRRTVPPGIESFADDFVEVLSACEFVEVTSVIIAGMSSEAGDSLSEEQSKISRVIHTILRPVPGDSHCLFYCGGANNLRLAENDAGSLSSDDGSVEHETDEGEDDAQRDSRVDDHLMDASSHDGGSAAEKARSKLVRPPIFFRFTLDGQPASVRDLSSISKSANLVAEISVFKKDTPHRPGRAYQAKIPWSHETAALELNALLKSFVAEQTIERLRHHGRDISDADLSVVKRCLRRVRSVVSFSIEVFIYVAKRDLMVSACAPAGGESEVKEGFHLLNVELQNNGSFAVGPVSGGGFVIIDSVEKHESLNFWCFVKVMESEGIISAQVYHPDGEEQALNVMSNVHEVISSCVHRVNQQLLLDSLHRSRTASTLLLPREGQESKMVEPLGTPDFLERFRPGVFSCPIVFRTVFQLFHRCATNPTQVARTLEATVLHSFAVSNRGGVFVYKDETGAIFYMSVQAMGSGVDADGKVELLVHGVREPGPSVTMQLRMLLQRRILQIAVDMLSVVLTKNPHFNWKQADLDFLSSFETDWKSLDDESVEGMQKERLYVFPTQVNDPFLVLLMFRQNLCGSTFFHRLHEVGGDGDKGAVPPISHGLPQSEGVSVVFNNSDFTVYYNNAPSKLDPNFQGVSTLTAKGEEYCRLAGAGIAIIQLSLMHADGSPVQDITVGQPVQAEDSALSVPVDDLRFRRVDGFQADVGGFCVRVKIIDTALKRKFLHEWILLTLNQALVGWILERLIEKSKLGILRPTGKALRNDASYTSSEEKMTVVDSFCTGLPAVISVLETAHDLPHPFIGKLHSAGVIRASSVATSTLELLENSILTSLGVDAKEIASSNFCVVRLSRSAKPRLVKLEWDHFHRNAVVTAISKEGGVPETVRDSPIDCPEYICFYCLNDYGNKTDRVNPPPRMSIEIMVEDGTNDRSASIEVLGGFKKGNHTVFHRSFAFVFSVKRDRRILWTYNWHPQLMKTIVTRLGESDRSGQRVAGRKAVALQLRSIRILSPPADGFKDNFTGAEKETIAPRRTVTTKEEKSTTEENRNKGTDHRAQDLNSQPPGPTPIRRIRRPVSIMRPKLVGKSVEGGALQAVAASRARASTNHFKNVASATSQSKRPPVPTNARDSRPPKSDFSAKDGAQVSRHPKDLANRDETLARIKGDFSMLCSANTGLIRRRNSLQRDALVLLANLWWPFKQNQNQTIARNVGDFLLSKAPIAWNDSCFSPPLPRRMADVFALSFARWVAAWTPGLEVLPVSSSNGSNMLPNSVLLASEIKNVHGCKCLAVVRISKVMKGRHKTIVRSEGWVVHLPRRATVAHRRKRDSNSTSMLSFEKDATGMDKIATELHNTLVLESLLFDFSASIVERAMRLLDDRIDYKELIPIVRSLITRYPLDHQKQMPMLNYRAFEATIVLKSYRDRLINMFDSHMLFERLCSEAEEREMVECGEGLCFKKGISVKGCHSICFITRHATDATKMQLVILCRTQGRNLSDFMFRDGSNVAIRILDAIAVEAAQMAYKELRFVSEKLRKDTLWISFSSSLFAARQLHPPEEGLREMLTLASVQLILQQVPSSNSNTNVSNVARGSGLSELDILFGPESGIDWTLCCKCMKRDILFSPHWSLDESQDGSEMYLFYLREEDLFLRIRLEVKSGTLLGASLVEKDELVTTERRQMAMQRVSNYLLHYMWHIL